MVPLVKTPYVTIQKRGVFSFNKASQAALGMPDAVELLYDPSERIIGVRPVEPAVEHAYPLRPNAREAGFMVSGTAFVKYYGISCDVSRRFQAYMEEGILCIDLKQEGTEVTSNRNGRGKQSPSTETDPTEAGQIAL